MNQLHPRWHFSVYKLEGQILLKMMFEQTYHSLTRTPNSFHVHQDLDLVRLIFGQISNHLAVVIGIFNVNGISLAEQKW